MRIRIVVSERGTLRGFDADGHAGTDGAGRNLACAAATMLLRTTARACVARGVAVGGGAPSPGLMSLSVAAPDDADAQWLAGVGDMLLRGVNDLQAEFPGEFDVRVDVREDEHGQEKGRSSKERS
jgi:uncharacterized protein YsxB (DUF464 family)